MTMNNDPRSSPPRGPYEPVRDNSMNWLLGLVALAAVAGAGWWAMGHKNYFTASSPTVQTTGQNAPVTPATPVR